MTTTAVEKLGPAERIIHSLLSYSGHMVHNRPGVITVDGRAEVGIKWEPVTHKEEGGTKVVYRLDREGKKTTKVQLGILRDDRKILNGTSVVSEYRAPGILPEVATWMYRQVADVWKLDNEFAARWASYAFAQEHRDLKVVLAAFMLVQNRKGDPVLDAGKVAFYDDDYRDIGEAMMLIHRKDGKDLNPKLLLRIHQVLSVPGVAQINRELGFGQSARHPFYGRWPKAVEKWLRYREENPKVLEGAIKAGFRCTIMDLARMVGYKPISAKFFELLRWKQEQASDGRRTLAIGTVLQAAESWEGLTEEQVCQKISSDKPDWKRVVGLLPKSVGATRAVVAVAVEAGSMSNKDLIIMTPTLEELGLIEVPSVKAKWERALRKAEDDMRAANIARNVHTKAVKEQLQGAADSALQKTIEVATRNLRVYFIIDTSGSMAQSIDRAKQLLAKFLQGFPIERTHVATFTTSGKILTFRQASATGVEQAFRGITAGGGTSHASGIAALRAHPPKDDEDSLLVVVGDGGEQPHFGDAVTASKLRPMAIGFLQLPGENFGCVERTAAALKIPCFKIDERTFDDVYAIPRTIRTLVAATPVGAAHAAAVPRVTLIDQILKTDLISKPPWAVTIRALASAAA